MSDDLSEMFREHARQDAEAQKAISDRLSAIEGTLKRYQGFVGGIMFVVSAFWFFATTFGKDLVTWLRG